MTYAQQKVSGTIKDAQRKPLEFNIVMLTNKGAKNTQLIGQGDLSGTSDTSNLQAEHYELKAEYLGYESLVLEFNRPRYDTVINLQFKAFGK